MARIESLQMHSSGNCGEWEGKVRGSLWILVVGKAQVGGTGHKWGTEKLGGNHEKFWRWWWWGGGWWWIACVVWLTDEWSLALFPVGAIVRDPHNRESPTQRMQSLNLRRTWVQA